MLFLLWLFFSFSKACSINEEFAYDDFMIFKNITGTGIVLKYLPILFAIQDLGIEAALDSPEMVAELIQSGCDVNSDEACLSFDFSELYDFNSTYIDYYGDNSTYEEYYFIDETESCQKRSILQIAVFLNSTNFIRELKEVHTFKSLSSPQY